MSDKDEWDKQWHTGLRPRLDTSFPKRCMNCGRIFATAAEFFIGTSDMDGQDKGLKPFVDDDTSIIIEAFRNCPCGSTLMEPFEQCEQNSTLGITRRQREEEFADSMKVEDPFAENASLAGSMLVDEDKFPESETPGDAKRSSPEGIAVGKSEKDSPDR